MQWELEDPRYNCQRCVWNSVHSNQGHSPIASPLVLVLFAPPSPSLSSRRSPSSHCSLCPFHSPQLGALVQLYKVWEVSAESAVVWCFTLPRDILPVVVFSGTPYQQVILGPCSTAHVGSLLLPWYQEFHVNFALWARPQWYQSVWVYVEVILPLCNVPIQSHNTALHSCVWV